MNTIGVPNFIISALNRFTSLFWHVSLSECFLKAVKRLLNLTHSVSGDKKYFAQKPKNQTAWTILTKDVLTSLHLTFLGGFMKSESHWPVPDLGQTASSIVMYLIVFLSTLITGLRRSHLLMYPYFRFRSSRSGFYTLFYVGISYYIVHIYIFFC